MKKEKNIQKELSERKVGMPNFFVRCIYYLIYLFTCSKMKCEYNIIDDPKKEKGPAVILQNHLSRFDHFFIQGALFPKKFTFMVAYNEFFRSGQSTFLKLFRCIPKRNSVADRGAMKKLIRLIKSGGTAVIAPEGFTSVDGKNHPVEPGSGHLLKILNVPVYYAELRGQYLTATKTCTDIRYSKCMCTIKKIYDPKDLESKTGEEIESDLNNLFHLDDYEWQKEKHLLWKTNGTICKDLQDLLYRCPKCGKIFSMISSGNKIECSSCGNGATMDDYYDFHPYKDSIIPDTPSKWSDFERLEIIKEIRNDKNYFYEEHVLLGELSNDHIIKGGGTSEVCGEGIFRIDHDGVHYTGTRHNEPFKIDLDYTEIHTILGSTDFSYYFVYKNGEYFDIFPQERRSGYHAMLLIEEMHRLHVNTYKNLPWYDYMYKNLETN